MRVAMMVSLVLFGVPGCRSGEERISKPQAETYPASFYVPAAAIGAKLIHADESDVRPTGHRLVYSLPRNYDLDGFLDALHQHLRTRGWRPLSYDLMFPDREVGEERGWVKATVPPGEYERWSETWVDGRRHGLMVSLIRELGGSDDFEATVNLIEVTGDDAERLLARYETLHTLPSD